MFHKCKITVVSKTTRQDLADTYITHPENFKACTQVEDNQEFIISSPFEIPEGICPWAWADIRPSILTIASGGSSPFLKEKNIALATCTDLFRPVVFKIERLEQ